MLGSRSSVSGCVVSAWTQCLTNACCCSTESFQVGSTTVSISQGSVVNFRGGAIVNAANNGGLGGGGVDAAVNKAGGQKLRAAREALPELACGGTVAGHKLKGTRIRTGGAVITTGGDLKAEWCIHAVRCYTP